jgi:hypothetical protein
MAGHTLMKILSTSQYLEVLKYHFSKINRKSIKEMKIIFSLFKILATALPFLRVFPLLAIVLLGTGALLFSVMYIQSIGSGLSSFGGLFIFSLVPIKPKRLTKSEREKISHTPELTEILVGLLLGDLAAF